MRSALIIPTCNAGDLWEKVLIAIDEQRRQPNRKILLDSDSQDKTVALAKQHGFEVHAVSQETFNPGLTRQLGATLCPEAEVLIYMTQDATPADPRAFQTLTDCFLTPQIAVAYGRHRPHPDACITEQFKRNYLYPDQSQIRTADEIPAFGLRTAFCSNSFAAWRKNALDEIGGFENTQFGEDMLATAKLILAGQAIAYCAEAEVIHSHPATLREAFQRGRQIGELHRHHPELRTQFGSPEKTGDGYLRQGIRFLAQNAPLTTPLFLFQSATKLLGFLSGKIDVF